jgi:hypothetical protein
MYDYPYRLEYTPTSQRESYTIYHSGEGVICEGENVCEMQRLVDTANRFYRTYSPRSDEDASYLGR